MWFVILVDNFNSIKVQLEPEYTSSSFTFPFVFQFHKGTIRTYHGTHGSCRNSHFNSIKVQLEHKFPQRSFHSILYFNSIKVQLEHIDVQIDTLVSVFQFHKGTIRTIQS